jgi:hypothetical protein
MGVAALSLAACGSTGTGKPSASGSSASSAPASANGKDRVAGLIASVSGSTIQVTQPSGTATVDFTPSTKISEVTPAQLTDIVAGSCLTVRPTRDSAAPGSGAITARAVTVGTAVDAKCPPSGGQGVRGTVASVNGNTIIVTSSDQSGSTSQTNVAVTNTTTYAKRAAANSQAIAQGTCIAARGTKDSAGALQATAINLRPAGNGTCPQRNGDHPRQGG